MNDSFTQTASKWQIADKSAVISQLNAEIEGDVLDDRLSRMLYATDASPYQQLPSAIARPRQRDDCIAIMKYAARHRLPLIPRAAGTSLAGQCVGEGLVVDCGRYMNHILEVDGERRWARVQAGVIGDDLNDALRPLGLLFAPDPSTSNRCTISGMLGNNAWGTHALHYGTTRDHVLAVEAVLSDGSLAHFGAVAGEELQEKLGLDNLEGHIYRTVYEAIDRHRQLILRRYPRPDGITRNAGYALDVLAQGQPWEAQGPPFNLAKLLCGSEGTLALVTAIELNLVPLSSHRRLIAIHFASVHEALASIVHVMPHRPAAVELLDRSILALTQDNLEQRRNRFWLKGDPAAVLLVEFFAGSDARLTAQAESLLTALRSRVLGYAYAVLEGSQLEQAWALRKASLGLLMGMAGRKKAVTGIEDTAVPVADLPAYVLDIQALLARYRTNCVIYGPVGRGVLHLRPELDLAREKQKFAAILEGVADLVVRYGGTISAKHGDGRLRAPFLERLLGREALNLLKDIKRAFDPDDLLNPHKLFDSPPPTEDLRIRAERPALSAYFDWRGQIDFNTATYQCNGAGACLKSAGRGTMCPSYMATREEKHGTRGRANIFRQVMASAEPWSGKGPEFLREALDLCLSCKGCKAECPANVDMARMKAEFLQHYYDRFGLPWRARIIGHFDKLSKIAGYWPLLSNTLLAQGWIKSLLGFHPQRTLPKLAKQRFSRWLKKNESTVPDGQRGDLVLFNDPFSEYYEPSIPIAAFSVLKRLGYRVQVSPCLESGRVQIGQGLLRQARARLTEALEWLYPHAAAGRFIIGLEPSEVLTFRDEAPDLLADKQLKQKAHRVAERVLLFEEWVLKALKSSAEASFAPLPKKLLVHGHCQQKALLGMRPVLDALSLIPKVEVTAIPSGCCGMAGAFGYEKEHYEISLKIAELILLPALRQMEEGALVVAPGTSCRHQIFDGLGIRAYHPAELFQMVLMERESNATDFEGPTSSLNG